LDQLFFNETFGGNGRTCGTCHPETNNFTIDPKFIATLPDDNPLFVAEFIPALSEDFEKPELMRKVGLILENTNGFDDLKTNFTMRSVPHLLAMRTSLDPPIVLDRMERGWFTHGSGSRSSAGRYFERFRSRCDHPTLSADYGA
jgi:hypothetical protein